MVHNPRDHWIPLEVPQIVTRELWEAAQERLEYNRVNGRRNLKYNYLLRRRAHCAECAAKMTCQKSKSSHGAYGYYHCPAAAGFGDYARECQQKRYFRAESVDATVWAWVKTMLTDPEQLLAGMQAEQQARAQANQPIKDRLAVVEERLDDSQQKLRRLLELYLAGQFEKALLIEQKPRLEDVVSDLENERQGLLARLSAHTLTDEQVQGVQRFAEEVAQGLDALDTGFDTRPRIIELLDVQVCLAIDGGDQVAHVEAIMGSDTLRITTTSTDTCS